MRNQQHTDSELESIYLKWTATKKQYRDQMIEVGSLIHNYLVSELKKADGLNEQKRIALGVCRDSIILKIGERLGIKALRVNEIMCVYLVVRLLGDNQSLNTLSYSSLRRFRVLIHRPNNWRMVKRSFKTKKGGDYTRAVRAIVPSETEHWAIRYKPEETSKELFKRAVLEEWNDILIRDEIDSFLRSSKKVFHTPTKKTINTDYVGVKTIDSVLELVLSFSDPFEVIKLVEEGLRERLEKNKRIKAYQDLAEREEPLTIE